MAGTSSCTSQRQGVLKLESNARLLVLMLGDFRLRDLRKEVLQAQIQTLKAVGYKGRRLPGQAQAPECAALVDKLYGW